MEGHLLQKIRKEFRPVHSQEFRVRLQDLAEKRGLGDLFKKIRFPGLMPPIQHIFSDDAGRLFIMTYQKGQSPGEYQCDIFNQEGAFIARTSLKYYLEWQSPPLLLNAKAKNNRIYCPFEKETGFKELVVYKMRWE